MKRIEHELFSSIFHKLQQKWKKNFLRICFHFEIFSRRMIASYFCSVKFQSKEISCENTISLNWFFFTQKSKISVNINYQSLYIYKFLYELNYKLTLRAKITKYSRSTMSNIPSFFPTSFSSFLFLFSSFPADVF